MATELPLMSKSEANSDYDDGQKPRLVIANNR